MEQTFAIDFALELEILKLSMEGRHGENNSR